MGRLKRILPICLLGLSYLVALGMVMNIHVFYGGYEGLLYKALTPLFNGETLEIQGALSLSPQDHSVLSQVLTVDFVIEGKVNEGGLGDVSLAYLDDLGEATIIAHLSQNDGKWWLIASEALSSPIELNGFFTNVEQGEDMEGRWSEIYQNLTIEEKQVLDPRDDQAYLKRKVTSYKLDLIDLLDVSQLNEIEASLGQGSLEGVTASIDIQVDEKGDLLAVCLQGDVTAFDLNGWVTWVPR